MGSRATDKVLPRGVAAIVHALVEFVPVHELFQVHLKLWRENNALILDERRKAKAQRDKFFLQAPKAADSDEHQDWSVQSIFTTDRIERDFVRIPPELDRTLEQSEDPSRYHLLRSLDDKQDFSTTESFVLLAELHDAAYQRSPIGYAIDHIVGVAEAADMLKKGISQVAAQNLATLVERVLDLIEAQADSKSKNKTGKTLQQIIQRSRKKGADLVTLSRQHFVTHSDRESFQDAIEASHSKLTAAIEAQGRRTAKQIKIEAERQRQQQTDKTLVSADQLGAFAKVGEKVIRVALNKAGCKPSIESIGKGNPHQWRYCDAIQSLKAVKSGKLRSFIWPDSAAEVMPQKDSSKTPERK